MNQHGLGHVPFELDRAKRRLGCTHYMFGCVEKITLSAHYVDLLGEDEIRDTILHEIAHALTPYTEGDSHGAAWRAMARKIGATPKRCGTPSAQPEAKYKGKCKGGHDFSCHRLPQNVKVCSNPKCKTKPISERVIRWSEGGREVRVAHFPLKYRRQMESLKIEIALGRVS
jgi:predicted SprT family Zn-dependent metalloprotease